MRTSLGWAQLACGGTILAAVGCVPSVEEDPSLAHEGQVLALQFAPAEAAPKDATSVTALVANSTEGGVGSVRFDLCLARKALSDLGPVSPECINPKPDSDSVVDLGRGAEVAFTVPEDACRLFGPQRPSAEPGQPPGRPVDPDATGGFYQPVIAHAGEAVLGGLRLDCGLPGGSQAQVAEYNKQHTANVNPVLTSLEVRLGSGAWSAIASGDGPLAVARNKSVTFRSKWSEPESYLVLNSESRSLDRIEEAYLATFYGSAGGLSEHRKLLDNKHSVTTTWQATVNGPVTFWIVVRDGRGGIGFAEFDIEVD